jgi:transcriptional regulator with XRE-family HTH domain
VWGRLVPKSQFSEAYASFLAVLIAARRAAGLTQTQLADRLGRRQGFVSIVETGVRRLDLIEFCAFAKAMQRDPVELFSRI